MGKGVGKSGEFLQFYGKTFGDNDGKTLICRLITELRFRKLFTTIDSRLRFTADNLSDYSRYFNEYDYTESADEGIEGS